MLEKISEWGLVKYFGSLINPDFLGKRIDKIMELYNTNTFMSAAKRLLFWAVVIIVIATLIDLTFYWLRPDQKATLKKAKQVILEYKEKLLGTNAQRGRQSRR